MKVTVLLPTYNRDYFLEDCLDSVLNQTHEDIELIVGDNASTDNTPEILNKYRRSDSRVVVRTHSKNSGTPNTFINWGIENASGEFITFIDDDARYLPHRIERLLAEAEKGCEVLYNFARDIYLDDELNPTGKVRERAIPFPSKGAYIFGTPHLNFIDQSDIFATKEAMQRVGGVREDAKYQDFAIMAKMCLFYDIGFVPEILTVKYQGTESDYSDGQTDRLTEAKIDIF